MLVSLTLQSNLSISVYKNILKKEEKEEEVRQLLPTLLGVSYGGHGLSGCHQDHKAKKKGQAVTDLVSGRRPASYDPQRN